MYLQAINPRNKMYRKKFEEKYCFRNYYYLHWGGSELEDVSLFSVQSV